MSIHKDCGADIKWARRSDDPERFLPPLEYAGEAYMVDSEGNGIAIHTYRPHNCDPDRIIAWRDYQERLAAIKSEPFEPRLNDHEIFNAADDMALNERWEKFLPFPCTRCGAATGERCLNLSPKYYKDDGTVPIDPKTGEVVYVRHPHVQRIHAQEAAK